MRVGTGYDVHRFAEGRRLVLGGVEIPYDKGLAGHSDADAALHAVMDALLGAAALGDIGRHFPDTDPAYEGVSSMDLLKTVADLLDARLYMVENVDCTIVAQEPKLSPYLDRMAQNVADVLHIGRDQVNFKATTEEGLGFTGTKQGIAAQAVCCIASMLDWSVDLGDGPGCGGCAGCPGLQE